MSDPLAIGSKIFRPNDYHVTTGFLFTMDTVRSIWLIPASLVVTSHILAVLMAHHVITRLCQNRFQAVMLHIPKALFYGLLHVVRIVAVSSSAGNLKKDWTFR